MSGSCSVFRDMVKERNLEPDSDYRLVEADSPLILYYGRMDRRNTKEPVFDWAASGFSARFTGSSIGMILSDSGENDFSVFIDGKFHRRVSAEAGEHRILLARRLQPGEHRLDFYKSTESDQGLSSIKGFLLEPGSKLLPPEEADFRIQVFGDSLSSGHGAGSPGSTDEWHREEADACQTWAFFIAQAFDAELTLTAVSGRGILRNYGEPGPRSKVSFSELAWRVLLDDEELLVTETKPAPDLVIVCLGHNDVSPGYVLSREEFHAGYLDFLGEVRRRWPMVPVFCGSIQKDRLTDWLREIVDEERVAGDNALYWYVFSHLEKGEYGGDNHANVKAHQRFAREITPLIIEATGQQPVYWADCM